MYNTYSFICTNLHTYKSHFSKREDQNFVTKKKNPQSTIRQIDLTLNNIYSNKVKEIHHLKWRAANASQKHRIRDEQNLHRSPHLNRVQNRYFESPNIDRTQIKPQKDKALYVARYFSTQTNCAIVPERKPRVGSKAALSLSLAECD